MKTMLSRFYRESSPSRKGDTNALLICAALSFANLFSGYDTASAAAVIADQRFVDEWGLSSSELGAYAALINVGNCLAYLGPLIFLSKRLGRRWTMVTGATVLMTGAALVAGARHIAMLYIGRIIW